MDLSLYEIAKVVSAKNDVTIYEDIIIKNIEFDSRNIQIGDMFLPLKGIRDGHDFIETAFKNGAVATFSEKTIDSIHLLVEDVLLAFQTLARYYLSKHPVEVIAVTGSNGKTTTKDMIAQLLGTTYHTYKTQGNYNNEIGLPYTILHMPLETEKLVLEMGQDHLGDIHLLSEIAKPTISVVTLIGEAHLAFFNGREEIAKGKLQIADGMLDNGILVVPNDDLILPYLPKNQKVIFFGDQSELCVENLVEKKESLTFEVPFLGAPLTVPVTGKYNATNAMLAAYVAVLSGVSEVDIHRAFETLKLTKNRTEWLKAANGADILSDVYNANPTAMRLILETFSDLPKPANGSKHVVLADMKELGEASVGLHNQIIEVLDATKIDTVICYGEDIKELAYLAMDKFPDGKVVYFEKSELLDERNSLINYVLSLVGQGDQILLKGSNSMHLIEVVNALVTGEEII